MSKSLLAEFHRDKFSTVQAANRILIDHLDGVRVRLPRPHSADRRITRLLVDREVLELGLGGTTITDLGRWALAEILGQYADTLLLAHLAVPKPADAAESPTHAIDTMAEFQPHISTEMS